MAINTSDRGRLGDGAGRSRARGRGRHRGPVARPLRAGGEGPRSCRRRPPIWRPTTRPRRWPCFAGGCFWGVQGVFQHMKGVTARCPVTPAAAGTAHYERSAAARRAMLKRSRSPSTHGKSATRLLQVFFSVAHDPTQLNRQGQSRAAVRSAIFPTTRSRQRRQGLYRAVERGTRLQSPHRHDGRDERAFYRAEDYHQDYLTLPPTHPYIVDQRSPEDRGAQAALPDPLSGDSHAGAGATVATEISSGPPARIARLGRGGIVAGSRHRRQA